jgi:hypothetical protein
VKASVEVDPASDRDSDPVTDVVAECVEHGFRTNDQIRGTARASSEYGESSRPDIASTPRPESPVVIDHTAVSS